MKYRRLQRQNGLEYIFPCEIESATEYIRMKDQIIYELVTRIDELEAEKAELLEFINEQVKKIQYRRTGE